MDTMEGVAESFRAPKRFILQPEDLTRFKKSAAYRDLLGYILMLNDCVKSKEIGSGAEGTLSAPVEQLQGLLTSLDSWIDEIPPLDDPLCRFGNKAYRDWHARLEERAEQLISPLVPGELSGSVIELKSYLCDAFGNKMRIDYGSGHELNFVAFLCCLSKMRVLQEGDSVAVVLVVFQQYLKLMRRLIRTYRMEPAGSQGVWGLDDHQFLPFLWGSSQLIGHERIMPHHFPEKGFAEKHAWDFMFMGCIAFINTVKSGPFHEHSNVLWGISGVPHWGKVNSGLVKMYKAEVLDKFPVMQHLVFGSLLPFTPA